MTTEDDFQAALDADPNDWQTRLVLADWLDDRGDPRGPGYRALGANQIRPVNVPKRFRPRWLFLCGSLRLPGGQWVPHDWFALLHGVPARRRRDIENVAASAFPRLPAARRAELLLTPVV